MAKTVKPIAVELEIKGGEKMAVLNKSFRDLSKQVKLSDTDIRNAVKGIQDFAEKAGSSEAVIKGQIKAFEGLREQAKTGGKLYVELGKKAADLKASLEGLSQKSQEQAKRFTQMGKSASASTNQIKSAIKGLQNLSKEAVADSNAFVQLRKDIEALGIALEDAEEKARKKKETSSLLSGVIRKSASLISVQARAYKEAVKATEEEIRAIDRLTKKQREAGETAERRAVLEAKLQKQLLKAAETGYLEFVASGRRETIKLAEAFNSADQGISSFNTRLRKLDEDFGKLPNTTAGINQKIAELNIQLSNTNRTSSDYTRISNEILSLQKELTKETGAYADAFAELNRQQESAARRRGKLAGVEEYIASVSGLGAAAAAERAARGGTPVVGQMRREGFPQAYRDPETGALIAPGYGARGDRRAYQEAEELKRIAEAQKQLEATFGSAVDSYRDALQAIQQYQEQRHNEFMSQIAKEDEAQQKAFAEQVAREEEAFKQELRRRDILLQAQKAAASALGLGGREDISSLYQGIIGLSTADVRRQQQMMGRSATEVLNDIATAFQKGGRAVDLKTKSTDIGDSIAQGISKGASDSDDINKGAKTFVERFIAAYKRVFEIRSPSRKTEQKIGLPLGLGIIKGLLQGLRKGKREVQQEIQSIVEDPIIPRSRQPRRLIGTVNQPIATFTGYGTMARPATPGYRPLGSAPAEASREIDQMFNRFRAGIAALTTDVEIYYNLLQRLPASRITTDLAALASRRADAMSPGFLETQRVIGPGDLEKEITAAVAGYLRDVRTPNPWIGVVGDYKAFINAVSSQTKQLRASVPALPAGKVAGLLPPASGELTPAQQQRVARAYARSDERSAQIFAEDARNRLGPAALPPGIFGGALAAIGGGGAGGRGGTPRGAAGDANGTFANLNRTLVDFGRLSDRSTADIRELGASLKGLQDILSPLDADFNAVNNAIERQSRLIDKELRKRERGRRRMSAGQFAQAAGATISGGIFGGPEGFLGGAIGTAFGGPGGAFAGAAIGAQVGQLRQSIGGTATYAAGLEKLRTALKGVADGTGEYELAIKAAQEVTSDLNIPQDVAVQGMTRLAAAVKGANGPITDAEIVMKNVSAAIKATGGNAQDIQGAITAMVQVFSKGKVSAEELSGQLGERLPGAVTLFAEANELSLVDLQKALKNGEVGLNELMKFIVKLGDTYGGTARSIADSNAEAGARLQRDISVMRDQIGTALIPIGAAFQEAFAEFIREITPKLVEVLPKIGQFFLDVFKNIEAVTEAAVVMLTAFAVGKIAAIVGSIGSFSLALKNLAASAVLARKSLIGLKATALLNPYVALGAGAAYLAIQIHKSASEQRRLNALIREGPVAEVQAEYRKAQKETIEAEQVLFQRTGSLDTTLTENEKMLGTVDARFKRAYVAAQAKERRLKDALERAKNDARQGADLDLPALTAYTSNYEDPTGGDGDEGGNTAKRKSQLDDLLHLSETLDRKKEIYKIDEELRKTALVLVRAEEDKNKQAIDAARRAQINLEASRVELEIEHKYLDALRAAGKFDTEGEKQQARKNALDEKNLEIANLTVETKDKLASLSLETAILAEREAKALGQARFGLRNQLGLVPKSDRVARAQADFAEQYPGATEADLDLIRQKLNPTFAEGLQQAIRNVKEELDELTNPINLVVNGANAIGTAFTDSFMSVITGSATTQEALASFFKNVGDYFLDMAAEIIKKMIYMAFLNTIVSLLPSSGGGGGGGRPGTPGRVSPQGLPYYGPAFANGGVFGENGIVPFAMGGIVSKPTLFQYANGGSGRFGLMGEAGAEAIMPLRRTSSGRLGVEASGAGVGNVIVNVDAKGTSVEGDDNSSRQLGKMIGMAVRTELIKQKRPGGILSQ